MLEFLGDTALCYFITISEDHGNLLRWPDVEKKIELKS